VAEVNARGAAVKILYEVFYRGAYSNIALKKELGAADMSDRDRALCSELVYGVLRSYRKLDYYIQNQSSLPMKKISDRILLILRLSFYQLLFSDAVPDRAVCSEAVKLARRYGHGASAGYVNAVLRGFIRLRDSGALPPVKGSDELETLSIDSSIPSTVIEAWRRGYGQARARELCGLMSRRPSGTTIRANTLKTDIKALCGRLSAEGAQVRSIDGTNGAVVSGAGSVDGLPAFKEGLFWVQSLPSQAAADALGAERGMTVLDMCAAPGGKTFSICCAMGDEGRIIAFDLHEHRCGLIKRSCERLGLSSVEVRVGDARVLLNELEKKADRVLCDVPCSGWGMLAGKPDIRLRSRDEGLCDIQYDILSNASRYVKRGGVLVYSTCTLMPDENEGVIERFLREHGGWRTEPVPTPEILAKSARTDGDMLTVFPNGELFEGFFICRLKRSDTDD